ncbi:hypothetical protein [Rubrobacter calidifluminis]|uniref:hypothetical protein n=1 Tax=Rubrobacter calidifluminis TaxID=1392640 RepID=UPI00235E351C|nr:hypothetical protein [Rubrobacter calidifluminis]
MARAASEAALAVEGVVRLGSGVYAEAATYGANDKVVGVVVGSGGELEVHVVAGYPPPKSLPELGREVKDEVSRRVGNGRREVSVVIDDVEEVVEG